MLLWWITKWSQKLSIFQHQTLTAANCALSTAIRTNHYIENIGLKAIYYNFCIFTKWWSSTFSYEGFLRCKTFPVTLKEFQVVIKAISFGTQNKHSIYSFYDTIVGNSNFSNMNQKTIITFININAHKDSGQKVENYFVTQTNHSSWKPEI